MLASSSVSPAALPGIAKVLERYVLIYEFDDILRSAKIKAKKPIQVTGSGGMLRLVEDGGLLFLEDYVEEQKKRSAASLEKQVAELSRYANELLRKLDAAEKKEDKDKIKEIGRELNNVTREHERAKKELEHLKSKKADEERKRDIAKDRRERGKADVRTVQFGGEITAEPTWVKIDTHVGSSVVGVKVIPFPVVSDASLSELMMSDRRLNFLMAGSIQAYRKILKTLYRLWYATIGKLPFLGRSPLTGNPRKDVIFNRSLHRDKIFICLSMMDFDNEFFQSAGGITKLYSLGWSSFVVADDVNKRASFCMKQFKGLCSTVQYSFIYSSLDQSKVYEDLEDVRRASSPFFRMSTKSSKLLGECVAASKLEEFLEEGAYLQEDFKSFMNRLTPKALKRVSGELSKAAKVKNVSKIKKSLMSLKPPLISMEEIEKQAKRKIPNFKKSYELSKEVVRNSIPNIPEGMVSPLSALVAIKSSTSDDYMTATKDNLKMVVAKLRSPNVQRQIGTEKIIAPIITVLFAGGLVLGALSMGPGMSALVLGVLFVIMLRLREPSETIV
jgi:hypothetical protein